MADERRPLVRGELVWTIRRSDAKMGVIIGPDPFTSDNEDMWLQPDPSDPTQTIFVDSPIEAIQRFITLQPDQYAVIHNPSETFPEDKPNGSWGTGRGQTIPNLIYGAKRVVTGGYFPRWPGQCIEIRNVHHLSTSEYLVAIVQSPDVDTSAPYYELTARCASIRKAVVDETVASKEDASKTEAGTEGATQAEADGDSKARVSSDVTNQSNEQVTFTVGQRIIIPGNLTPTYIPPTGIEVLCETENKEVVAPEVPADVMEAIKWSVRTGILTIENLSTWLNTAGLPGEYDDVNEHYRRIRLSGNYSEALERAIIERLDTHSKKTLANTIREAYKKPAQEAGNAIRQAVVLGPTDYCVLLDEDGRPQTKQGPGRIFPGPYDRFRTANSSDGVYQAYHLRSDRGILLRVVADISAEELRKQLPVGSEIDGRDQYRKGDELFIGGSDAYFVPSSSLEVINPSTRQPHAGNDHSQIYIKAIGVDQKSGVYIASVETGNVELARGELKLLLDPRKQSHVTRNVPANVWNLLIARGESHKQKAAGTMVATPWALSVVIPNNEAVLITSKDGRRVVTGPCTDLLEYEEWPEILGLSSGTPKRDDRTIQTCFLRVAGNRVSDIVEVVTADLVTIEIHVRYGVTFVGQSEEEQVKWFNDKDYVGLLCDNERSRLRSAARQHTLNELHGKASEFIRDTILGVKQDGAEHRPGHLFTENNMMVTEVEILDVTIPDQEVAARLADANRQIVTFQIDNAALEASLAADRRKAEVSKEKAKLTLQGIEQDEKIARAQATSKARLAEEEFERSKKQRTSEQQLAATLSKAEADSKVLLADVMRRTIEADAKSELDMEKARQEALADSRERFASIEREVLEAIAKADVDRLKAVQPGFIEAIEGLGDKQVLASFTDNLPEATGELGFALGLGGFPGLMTMLGNSPLASTMEKIRKTIDAQAAKMASSTKDVD